MRKYSRNISISSLFSQILLMAVGFFKTKINKKKSKELRKTSNCFSQRQLYEWTGTGELVIPSERPSLSLMCINSFFSLIFFFSSTHSAPQKHFCMTRGKKAYTASGKKTWGSKKLRRQTRENVRKWKRMHHTKTCHCVWLNRARAQRNNLIDNLTPVEL